MLLRRLLPLLLLALPLALPGMAAPADVEITTPITERQKPGTNNSVIIKSGGALNVTGNTATGGAVLLGGTGSLDLQPGGTLNATSNSDGAVKAQSSGTVTLNGTAIFTNNTATNNGGAVYTYGGNVTIAGTATFTKNTASYGGAVYANTGTVTIAGNATFTNNTATNNGGGGGAVYVNTGTVTVNGENIIFSGNNANGSGGAVYAYDGNVTIDGKAALTNNSASSRGGAVFAQNGNVTILGSATFSDNTATSNNGGAVFAQNGNVTVNGENITFSGNNASGNGGAVSAGTGTVAISGNAAFTNNTATYGGAVYAYTGAVAVNGENIIFSGNRATRGGAVSAANKNTIILGNATFTNNTATSNHGGAVYAEKGTVTVNGENITFSGNNANDSGGAVYASTGNVAISGNAIFTNNTANSGKGGAVYADTGNVTISGNAAFTNNKATTGYGGAVYADTGNVTISGNATFTDNRASGSGGAVCLAASGSTLTLTPGTGDTVLFNTSSDSIGGAGGLVISGAGSVIFNARNSYIGDTVISGGMTTANTLDAFSSSRITLSGGVLTLAGSGTFSTPVSGTGGAIGIANNMTLSPGALASYAGSTTVTKNNNLTLASGAVVGGNLTVNTDAGLRVTGNTSVGGTLRFGDNSSFTTNRTVDTPAPLFRVSEVATGSGNVTLVMTAGAVGEYTLALMNVTSGVDNATAAHFFNPYRNGMVYAEGNVLYAKYGLLDLLWDGASGGVWETGNLTNGKWTSNWNGNLTNEAFYAGDHVAFNDNTAAGKPVTVSGTVEPGGMLVSGDNYTFSGINSAVITPQNTAVISGSASFSNITFANAASGALNVTGQANLSDVTLASNSGANGGAVLVGGSGVLRVTGNTTFTNNSASGSGGAVYLAASGSTLSLAPGAGDTVLFSTGSDSIGGAGGLTISGAGSVIFNAGSNYTGGTVISAGNVTLNTLDALGTGNVSFTGGLVTLNAPGVFDNKISGAANGQAFAIAGGNVTLAAGALNAYSGETIFSGAGSVLTLASGALVGGNLSVGAGATLNVTDSTSVTGTLAFANGTIFQTGSASTLNLFSAGNVTFAGERATTLNLLPAASAGSYTVALMDVGDAAHATEIADGKYLINPYHGGVITQNDGVLYAQYAVFDLTWNGTGAALWDTGNLANRAWLANGTPEFFATGDHVTFDNTAADKTVTLSGTLEPGGMFVSGDNYVFSGINSATLTLRNTAAVISGSASFSNITFANAASGALNITGAAAFAGVTFANNTAPAGSGAIHNTGTITFAGDTVFTGNTAGGTANDIHNAGTLTFTAGHAALSGGISGRGAIAITGGTLALGSAKASAGAFTMNGGRLDVGTGTLDADTFQMSGGTLGLDVTDAASAGAYGRVIANTISITGGTLDLTLTRPDGTYPLLTGTITDRAYALNYATDLYTVTDNADGTFAIAAKGPAAAIGSPNQNRAATGLQATINAGNTNPVLTGVLAELQTNRAGGLRALDTLAPDSSRLALFNHEGITGRLFNQLAGRTETVQGRVLAGRGRSAGDGDTSRALWLQPLYNHARQRHSTTSSGFSVDTLGFVLGGDTSLDEHLTLGLAYSYARSDAESVDKDFDIDTHTFLAYGRYNFGRWHLDGAGHFAYAGYDEDKAILGGTHTARYHSNAFGANLRLGYDLDCGFTPEAGLRYRYVTFGDYTDSLGQRVHNRDVDTLTALMGGSYTKTFRTARGTLTPRARLAASWDLANKDGVAVVSLPGASYQTISAKSERWGAEGGLGLDWQRGNWTFSADYALNVREKYTSQSVLLKVLYTF